MGSQRAPIPCLPYSGFTIRSYIFKCKISDLVVRQLIDIKDKTWSLVLSSVLLYSDNDL